MNQIGFVLLTHANPPQIKRLVSRLNTMFDAPPIVIHHDFGKCRLPEDFLPGNVTFVRPHLETSWAAFSVVQATLRGLELLFARSDAPEWAVVLSGTHYPTKSAARIVRDLTEGGFDAHVDARPIGREYQQTTWHRMHYQRHCVKHFAFALFDKRLRPKTRNLALPPRLGDRLLPFHAGLRPFGGSQWFSISRRAAEYIAAFEATRDAAALARHYRNIPFSEEAYFQTALCSNPALTLNFNNWLYLDWSEEKPHPKTLTLADLPALQSSATHFARKFDPDESATLLDALDNIIDGNFAPNSTLHKEAVSL